MGDVISFPAKSPTDQDRALTDAINDLTRQWAVARKATALKPVHPNLRLIEKLASDS